MNTPDWTTYMGEPIDQMSREELIEALKVCANMLHETLRRNIDLHDEIARQIIFKATMIREDVERQILADLAR